MKIAIVGNGHVGKAYLKMFPDAVTYDEPDYLTRKALLNNLPATTESARNQVNDCELAIISVPTNLSNSGKLDMSIVEEVVGWLETPLILIKSALQPGTVDRLVKKTGKNIAVSVEFIGEGKYYTPPEKYPDVSDPRKHRMLVVGGEETIATRCAEILWSKMSPDTRIHILTALEAEIVKLVENTYGALKVTWANAVRNLVEKSDSNPIRVHQAWTADGRVDSMHTRTVSHSRGWQSKCWDKDTKALQTYANQVGAKDLEDLIDTIIQLNRSHLADRSFV